MLNFSEYLKITFLTFSFCFYWNVGRTQEIFSYNFTNVTHNQNFTVHATTSDFVKLVNVGQEANYHLLFGEDLYFSPEDAMSSHNVLEFFSNQQERLISLSSISSSHFYIRVTRENGIQLLTIEVIMGSLQTEHFKTETPSIFPNPVSDYLQVQNAFGTYAIYDFVGKMYVSGSSNQTEVFIDTSELPQGFYIIAIDEKWFFKFQKN